MKKIIRILLICVAVLMSVTVVAAAVRQWGKPLAITLNGKQDLYLEYGQTYEEAGAFAEFSKKGVSYEGPVDISGEVDAQTLGSYLIKYTVRDNGRVYTNYRRVHVVDTEVPVITLKTDPNSYTLIGETYVEEGFTAKDNYDGDITDKVIRREKDGVVTYTVTDSSGNTTVAKRTINYIDPTVPQLVLEGGQTAFIMAGDIYAEPGCRATDMTDGDLTSNVIISGDVDATIAGIYTLQYSVTNSLGVTATKDRIIYVIPQQEKEETEPEEGEDDIFVEKLPTVGTTIEPNGKVIYLTFDDGPSSHTGRLLDVLKKYGVKVTFFVKNSTHLDMLTRAAEEGHAVAIHTFSHNYSKIYASDEAFMADLKAIQDVIYQYTGKLSMLTRFPGGGSNTVSSAYNRGIMTRLTKHLEELGYQYFDWNVDSNDAGGAKSADEVYENVIKGIGNRQNSVVLQHDTQDFSVDAVERIIAWGLCNGYTFKPLDHDSPTCHHPVNN